MQTNPLPKDVSDLNVGPLEYLFIDYLVNQLISTVYTHSIQDSNLQLLAEKCLKIQPETVNSGELPIHWFLLVCGWVTVYMKPLDRLLHRGDLKIPAFFLPMTNFFRYLNAAQNSGIREHSKVRFREPGLGAN